MREPDPAEVIIGVGTHKHVHAAAAINALGARLGTITIPVNRFFATLECELLQRRRFASPGREVSRAGSCRADGVRFDILAGHIIESPTASE